MTNSKLNGKKIAFLATDGFEQVELTQPKKALEAAGAQVDIVSLKEGKIKGFHHAEPGDSFAVDKTIDTVNDVE